MGVRKHRLSLARPAAPRARYRLPLCPFPCPQSNLHLCHERDELQERAAVHPEELVVLLLRLHLLLLEVCTHHAAQHSARENTTPEQSGLSLHGATNTAPTGTHALARTYAGPVSLTVCCDLDQSVARDFQQLRQQRLTILGLQVGARARNTTQRGSNIAQCEARLLIRGHRRPRVRSAYRSD